MGCGGRLPGVHVCRSPHPVPVPAATWASAGRARERTANPRCGSWPASSPPFVLMPLPCERRASVCPYRVHVDRRRGMGCGGRLPGMRVCRSPHPVPVPGGDMAVCRPGTERTANPRCGSWPALSRRSSSCPYRVNAVRPCARTRFTWIGVGAWGAAGVCRACASAGRRIPCPCRAAHGGLPVGHENERRTRAVARGRHHPAVRPHAPTASRPYRVNAVRPCARTSIHVDWRWGMGCGGRLPGVRVCRRRIPCPCRAATWRSAGRARERTANPRCGSWPAPSRRSSSCPYRVNAVRPCASTGIHVDWRRGMGCGGRLPGGRVCQRRIPCPGRMPVARKRPTATCAYDWPSSRHVRLNSFGGAVGCN